MKELSTKRLIVRRFKETDLLDFYEYAKVEGVGEMAGWPSHKSIEDSKLILNSFLDNEEVYALVYKENNKVIGSIGIHKSFEEKFEGQKQKELGYVLSKEYWKQGLMTEATKMMINHCFLDLGIEVLTCGCFNINENSRKIIEKNGFIFLKDREYNAKLLNKVFESKLFYLTKEDFIKNCRTDFTQFQ